MSTKTLEATQTAQPKSVVQKGRRNSKLIPSKKQEQRKRYGISISDAIISPIGFRERIKKVNTKKLETENKEKAEAVLLKFQRDRQIALAMEAQKHGVDQILSSSPDIDTDFLLSLKGKTKKEIKKVILSLEAS